jgi:hypothetical protein
VSRQQFFDNSYFPGFLLAHLYFHPLILSLLGGDDIFPDELHHDNIADQQHIFKERPVNDQGKCHLLGG